MRATDKVDRYGLCPNCKVSWDLGDIFQYLSSLSVNTHKSESEIKQLAASYGWTEFNPGRFSRAEIIEMTLTHKIYYRCPEIRCGHVWEAETGREYDSMYSVLRDELYDRKEQEEVVAEVKESQQGLAGFMEDFMEVDSPEDLEKLNRWFKQ